MKDGLYYNGAGSPYFELNADTICVPVDFTEKGRTFRIYVRLKPFDFAANKKLLNNVTISESREVGANVAEQITSGEMVAKELAEVHFLELNGIIDRESKQPIDNEKQKAWLSARPGVKESIGLRAGMFASKSFDETEGELFYEDEGDTQEIDTDLRLADFEKKTEITVTAKHILRIASEEERQTYRKTTKTRTKNENKREVSWITRNFDNVAKLYDKMAISLEGVVIDGQHCTEANKEVWLPKVPLTWKSLVLTEAFSRIDSKNG